MTTAGGGVPHVNYDQAMANTEPGGETSNFDIQSVSRVGQILSLFGPRTVELTAADIAERVGLNRTTAYRYAMSMVTAGILAESYGVTAEEIAAAIRGITRGGGPPAHRDHVHFLIEAAASHLKCADVGC